VTGIRQQISEMTAILADTASGQQALFALPRNTRRPRPAATRAELHQLITELAVLAADAVAQARRAARRPAATAPQTAPLFDELDAPAR